jgi:hypothetical protein
MFFICMDIFNVCGGAYILDFVLFPIQIVLHKIKSTYSKSVYIYIHTHTHAM